MNIKQSELEVMVCDLFVDAYRAGASCGDNAYATARGSRARLIEKLGELYKEIEDLKQELEDERRAYSYLLAGYEELKVRHENLKKYGDENPDIRDMYPSFEKHDDSRLDPADYADLPFPDVETMAPAEEVEGAND